MKFPWFVMEHRLDKTASMFDFRLQENVRIYYEQRKRAKLSLIEAKITICVQTKPRLFSYVHSLMLKHDVKNNIYRVSYI